MTEDEAEAALLAIAGPLISWVVDGNGAWGDADLHSYNVWQDGGGTYRVLGSIHEKEHTECFEYDECDQSFETLAKALAACERHHASRMQGNREGKWD